MQENAWTETATVLLRKWESNCKKRKKAHYKTAKSFGWRHKLLAIPVIVISSILGSLSFIHPSFTNDAACATSASRLLSVNNTARLLTTDPYSGNCAATHCASECSGIVGSYEEKTVGYYDCPCCYKYWNACSWDECSDFTDPHMCDDRPCNYCDSDGCCSSQYGGDCPPVVPGNREQCPYPRPCTLLEATSGTMSPTTAAPTPEPNGYVPTLDNGPDDCCTHSASWDDEFTLMCQTCGYDVLGKGLSGITYKWYDNSAIQFQLTCSSVVYSDDLVLCFGVNNQNGGTPSYTATCEERCILDNPTKTPTTHAPTNIPTSPPPTPTAPTKRPTTLSPTNIPTSPSERCENYCQNSCAQFGTPEDNVSECQGCDDSKACHPGASNYNNVDAWCDFYPCDSGNSRCDNWRCTQPTNAPTPSERIIYNEAVSGEAHGTVNVGVDTLPLATGTNTILGTLKSPYVNDYYRVLAPGGATITAMRMTVAGDGTHGVKAAALRFFDATGQFAGQTGGGLIPSVPANAVSMLVAPSSFSSSASGFAGWAHGQSEFLFALMAASASGMSDNDYIIEIDCVVPPTPSPTATNIPTNLPPTPSPTATNIPTNLPPTPSPTTNTPTNLPPTPSPTATNTPTNLPPTPSPTGLAYSSREAAQDACSSSGSSYSFSSSTSTINGVSTCMYNCNGVEGLCQTGSTPTPLPTQQPTPPFEGKSGKSGDSDGDGDGDGDGEECAPGCPDDWPGDGECDDSCFNSACNYDDGDCPTTSPTNLPTTSSPTRRPTRQPTTSSPTKQPTSPPVSYMQGGASARSTEEDDNNDVSYISYIIGAFNMFVAILSAVHTFLKFDTLADRHQQYSRHFGNLQVDIETLLCLPESQRGDAGSSIENFKTKYSVLMNNAPELSVRLEQYCIDGIPVATQVHNVEIELA